MRQQLWQILSRLSTAERQKLGAALLDSKRFVSLNRMWNVASNRKPSRHQQLNKSSFIMQQPQRRQSSPAASSASKQRKLQQQQQKRDLPKISAASPLIAALRRAPHNICESRDIQQFINDSAAARTKLSTIRTSHAGAADSDAATLACPPHFYVAQSSPLQGGVDEAGRGPVLGSMVQTFFCFHPRNLDELEALKVDDSKKLTAQRRNVIFEELRSNPNFYFHSIAIPPGFIDMNLLKYTKKPKNTTSGELALNLNQIEYQCLKYLIDCFFSDLHKQVSNGSSTPPTKIFLDSVGNLKGCQKVLTEVFEDSVYIKTEEAEIIAETKADSKYLAVSAASIISKVLRDRILRKTLEDFVESNSQIFPMDCGEDVSVFGCGYPSDSQTIDFINKVHLHTKGFPYFIRQSWSTIARMIRDNPQISGSDKDLNSKKQPSLSEFSKPNSKP